MVFLHNIAKIALKSVILYVHFLTRTPFILLFYGVTLMGVFGGRTPSFFLLLFYFCWYNSFNFIFSGTIQHKFY